MRAVYFVVLWLVPLVAGLRADVGAGRSGETGEFSALSERMRGFVDSGEVAGVVTVVADGGGTLHLGCEGFADIKSGRKMVPDTVFWIASMSKPVTGTAVMMLHEAGLLSVDDPVSKHLPEFRDLKDGSGNAVAITIRHCLTHTSGLSEVSVEETAKTETLKDLMPLIAAKPARFTPGGKWEYSQSSIQTAARIVEVVSGMSFPEFLEKRLFGPLGMKDTTFYPDKPLADRIATSYRRDDAGNLVETPIFFLGEQSLLDTKRYPRASGGLFSTAPDYTRFCRMILNGGELDGRRYLKPESVALMTTVQSGGLKTGFTPGNGWGLGWCVVREPQGVSAALSPGSFGHGGAYGTQAWIDPVKKRVHLLMIQRAGLPNSDGSELRRALHENAQP